MSKHNHPRLISHSRTIGKLESVQAQLLGLETQLRSFQECETNQVNHLISDAMLTVVALQDKIQSAKNWAISDLVRIQNEKNEK